MVSSNAIESLVANSSLLENLKLKACMGPELRIGAPNLKNCYLGDELKEICLDAPLLASLYILLIGYTSEQLPLKSLVCTYTKFFSGLPNLEKLCVTDDFIKYLSVGIESCHDSLVFHRLEAIELYDVTFEDMKKALVVVRLLSNSPNLRTLKFICSDRVASKAPSTYFWDFECLGNCTFKRLKRIGMADICGALHEMKFIEFLLASSPVLELIIVGFNENHQLLNSRAELLSYPRASTKAEIRFLENLKSSA